MASLEELLAAAARSPDWEHAVIHRCAWCKRTTDTARDSTTSVVTDGMCAACAARALSQIASRQAARHRRAA
jgi:hypothetical protein